MVFRDWWLKQPRTVTKKEIQRLVGASQSTVGKWIRGVARPRGAHAIILREITGVEPGDWEDANGADVR